MNFNLTNKNKNKNYTQYSKMYYKLSLVENNSSEDLSGIKEKMDNI